MLRRLDSLTFIALSCLQANVANTSPIVTKNLIIFTLGINKLEEIKSVPGRLVMCELNFILYHVNN